MASDRRTYVSGMGRDSAVEWRRGGQGSNIRFGMGDRLYEVWLVAETTETLVARFSRFDDAKQYCQAHAAEGRHDVKMPNGRWYGRRNTEPVDDPDAYSSQVD